MDCDEKIRFFFMDEFQAISNIGRFSISFSLLIGKVFIFFPRQINERTCLLQIIPRKFSDIQRDFFFLSLVLSDSTPVWPAVSRINYDSFTCQRKWDCPPHQLTFMDW